MNSRNAIYDVAPSAARLTASLRDIGYDFSTALADIIDNSVTAGATDVNVETVFDGHDSYVMITDNGRGMGMSQMLESLRFGTRREYRVGDLGRFGLGLKTASLSQCRRLTVVSRRTPVRTTTNALSLDMDMIERLDQWVVTEPEETAPVLRAKALLAENPGTVVIWEELDRVIPERQIESGWGKRRLTNTATKAAEHLAMVFHRFLDGLSDGTHLVITVNGQKLRSWDPFATKESTTTALPKQTFEIDLGNSTGQVKLQRFVLPARGDFSSPEEFERLSGPNKWNRQQGLYIYRANRLVQYGGWNGIRAIDEHTKLARAALEFDTDLDEAFQINVAKMRVLVPVALKPMLDPAINELCIRAGDVYRRSAPHAGKERGNDRRGPVDYRDIGVALRAAALEADQLAALTAALEVLKLRAPEVWQGLGLDI
jgi:anti-sigma regulatory factor (Ser/Thr protein kinase)